MTVTRVLRAATRGSPLALWQTREVARLLAGASGGEIEVVEVVTETTGDRRRDVPIHQIGGQGVFAKEVQAAVLDGRADLAVHSAKDLPPRSAPGLVLACVPPRGDPRDALVGASLAGLGPGALVGTGSVRRRAQLAWHRPDLTFTDLRGNIDTRLGRVGELNAVVVAMAALERLGRAGEAAQVLSAVEVVPQVAQGALAVECREADAAVLEALALIEHGASRAAVDAERAFLDTLGGACDLPVGAHAVVTGGRGAGGGAAGGGGGVPELRMEGLVASGDGRVVIRRQLAGPVADSVGVGARLAAEVLGSGGAELLGR